MEDQPIVDLSGRTLGEFVLREQIGKGGYAVVYRARQPKLERDVVVKVLHARRRRNEAVQERFLQEARLASRFDRSRRTSMLSTPSRTGWCGSRWSWCRVSRWIHGWRSTGRCRLGSSCHSSNASPR